MSAGVIVGYDGSIPAKEAVRAAIDVGKAYGDKVIVACAYDVNPLGGEVKDYAAALKELANKRLREATELAGAEGAEVEAVMIERAPAEGLVELATERDARVIVIGTRGEGRIRGALLGSTAHKLLHMSHHPVLVIPHAGG
jgi:nucleotide-binding universal stress UspA family protein